MSDSRNLAPKGWHVPTDDEWTILSTFLGGLEIAGDKLKETGTLHWIDNISNNESGFTALPGGGRTDIGTFEDAGDAGYWWSSTESSDTSALGRGLFFYYEGVAKGFRSKVAGFSVRCMKD